jgi:hypothetical protein
MLSAADIEKRILNFKNIKMKKKLEDYLPFYIGCKMQYASHHEPQDELYTLNVNNLKEAIEFGDFIVLRPLNDMTEEEVHDCVQLGNLVYRGEKPKYFIVGWNAFSPIVTKYLLSKGFDLFGLIESGLAVNAAEIKSVSSR